jgi:hypothetical protein
MDVADLVRPRRVKAMTGLIGSMAYALLSVSPVIVNVRMSDANLGDPNEVMTAVMMP